MGLFVFLGAEPAEYFYFIYACVGAGLIVFQHRDNIARLLAGTERKVGQKAEKRE